MPKVFVDSAFYVAMIDDRDDLHTVAQTAFTRLVASPDTSLVTSDLVLAEVLTYFSRYEEKSRAFAAELATRVLGDPTVSVISFSRDLLIRSIELYATRLDKQYSIADCSSMIICEDNGIRQILTHDHDFVREGFEILF